jgi:predicted O-methyltransferase YrrM
LYSSFTIARKFIKYYLASSNGKGHGMHSPFVFDFIRRVLMDNTQFTYYNLVEDLRKRMLDESRTVAVVDFGAGTSGRPKNERKISAIAKRAAKPAKYGQLLYRMAHYYKPATMLELGTSLGITSSYIALGNPTGKLVTLEGAPAIAGEARKNFSQLQLNNVEVVEGNFDETLETLLKKTGTIDFAFIDGNHREEPTVRYFRQILEHTSNDSIMVFDDIHWSVEMERAWEEIKNHESVRASIDLFFIGIIFFREEFLEKRHFSIRF